MTRNEALIKLYEKMNKMEPQDRNIIAFPLGTMTTDDMIRAMEIIDRITAPVHPITLTDAVELGAEFAALYTGNGVKLGYHFPLQARQCDGKVWDEPQPEAVTSYLRMVVRQARAS